MIWVFEIWPAKAAHDAAATPRHTRGIATAMPMLAGEFTGHDVSVVGGLGL